MTMTVSCLMMALWVGQGESDESPGPRQDPKYDEPGALFRTIAGGPMLKAKLFVLQNTRVQGIIYMPISCSWMTNVAGAGELFSRLGGAVIPEQQQMGPWY